MCFTTHSWVNWRIRACLRGKIRARQFGIGISRCDERAVPRGRAMQRLTGTKRLDIGEALPGLSVAAPKGASRGAVAQLGERYTRTVEVGGSTPLGSTCARFTRGAPYAFSNGTPCPARSCPRALSIRRAKRGSLSSW